MKAIKERLARSMDLRSMPKGVAMAAALSVFGTLVLSFGVLYWSLDLLRHSDGSHPNLSSSLYFSLVTQATVGFGDIVASSGAGRAAVGAQIAFGVMWSAFVPALVVYRLLLPNDDDLQIGPYLIFNPERGRFRVRVANRGRAMGSGVMVRGWLRRPDGGSSTRKHHSVGIGHGIDAPSRFPLLPPDAPFYINFDVAKEELGDATDDVVGLHPAHVRTGSDVLVEVEMRSRFGTIAKQQAYDYAHVVCADGVDVQPVLEGPKTWPNFVLVTLRNSTTSGREQCLACAFRTKCSLYGKAE